MSPAILYRVRERQPRSKVPPPTGRRRFFQRGAGDAQSQTRPFWHQVRNFFTAPLEKLRDVQGSLAWLLLRAFMTRQGSLHASRKNCPHPLGSCSTRSPIMFFCTAVVPPAIVRDSHPRIRSSHAPEGASGLRGSRSA